MFLPMDVVERFLSLYAKLSGERVTIYGVDLGVVERARGVLGVDEEAGRVADLLLSPGVRAALSLEDGFVREAVYRLVEDRLWGRRGVPVDAAELAQHVPVYGSLGGVDGLVYKPTPEELEAVDSLNAYATLYELAERHLEYSLERAEFAVAGRRYSFGDVADMVAALARVSPSVADRAVSDYIAARLPPVLASRGERVPSGVAVEDVADVAGLPEGSAAAVFLSAHPEQLSRVKMSFLGYVPHRFGTVLSFRVDEVLDASELPGLVERLAGAGRRVARLASFLRRAEEEAESLGFTVLGSELEGQEAAWLVVKGEGARVELVASADGSLRVSATLSARAGDAELDEAGAVEAAGLPSGWSARLVEARPWVRLVAEASTRVEYSAQALRAVAEAARRLRAYVDEARARAASEAAERLTPGQLLAVYLAAEAGAVDRDELELEVGDLGAAYRALDAWLRSSLPGYAEAARRGRPLDDPASLAVMLARAGLLAVTEGPRVYVRGEPLSELLARVGVPGYKARDAEKDVAAYLFAAAPGIAEYVEVTPGLAEWLIVERGVHLHPSVLLRVHGGDTVWRRMSGEARRRYIRETFFTPEELRYMLRHLPDFIDEAVDIISMAAGSWMLSDVTWAVATHLRDAVAEDPGRVRLGMLGGTYVIRFGGWLVHVAGVYGLRRGDVKRFIVYGGAGGPGLVVEAPTLEDAAAAAAGRYGELVEALAAARAAGVRVTEAATGPSIYVPLVRCCGRVVHATPEALRRAVAEARRRGRRAPVPA